MKYYRRKKYRRKKSRSNRKLTTKFKRILKGGTFNISIKGVDKKGRIMEKTNITGLTSNTTIKQLKQKIKNDTNIPTEVCLFYEIIN